MFNILKKFDKWFLIKPKLDELQKYPSFQEGDIWWCHIGENVGHEECGKGDKYLRPVIIVKKFNHRIFYGIPTSSKIKNLPFYFQINLKKQTVSVLLSQMRIFDVKRLFYKQTRVSDEDLYLIKKYFVKIFLK